MSSASTLPSVSRWVPGPRSTWPASACCWSRAATLTASPVANVESRPLGDDLAGLDPDSGFEPEAVDRLEELERRANGPLGVVLVRLRDAERGHDGVAGELLDVAAVVLDAPRDPVEEAGDAAPDHLWIRARDQPGRVDQVHENNGGQLALHPSSVETIRTAQTFRLSAARNAAIQAARRRLHRAGGGARAAQGRALSRLP